MTDKTDRLRGRLFQMARAARKAQKCNTSEDCLMLEMHKKGRRWLQSLEKKSWKRFFLSARRVILKIVFSD